MRKAPPTARVATVADEMHVLGGVEASELLGLGVLLLDVGRRTGQ